MTRLRATLHRAIMHRAAWIGRTLERWLVALFVLGAMAAEWVLHLLNVPHMEGWWLSLAGGSGLISGSWLWWRRRAK